MGGSGNGHKLVKTNDAFSHFLTFLKYNRPSRAKTASTQSHGRELTHLRQGMCCRRLPDAPPPPAPPPGGAPSPGGRLSLSRRSSLCAKMLVSPVRRVAGILPSVAELHLRSWCLPMNTVFDLSAARPTTSPLQAPLFAPFERILFRPQSYTSLRTAVGPSRSLGAQWSPQRGGLQAGTQLLVLAPNTPPETSHAHRS